MSGAVGACVFAQGNAVSSGDTALPGAPAVADEPAAKRPRTANVDDSNLHLKFAYGLNAWRHWVRTQGLVEEAAGEATIPKSHKLSLDPLNLDSVQLAHYLPRFVTQVRKPNGESYAPDSVYYLCLGKGEALVGVRVWSFMRVSLVQAFKAICIFTDARRASSRTICSSHLHAHSTTS